MLKRPFRSVAVPVLVSDPAADGYHGIASRSAFPAYPYGLQHIGLPAGKVMFFAPGDRMGACMRAVGFRMQRLEAGQLLRQFFTRHYHQVAVPQGYLESLSFQREFDGSLGPDVVCIHCNR